jgi:type I restriction enzyme M protein
MLKSSMMRKKVTEYLKSQNTRDEFSKLLFKYHNIIRNNDKLSPEAAFDEISKICLSVRYERTLWSTNFFSKFNKSGYENTNQKTARLSVEQTKILKMMICLSEIIRIRENSFEAIVKKIVTTYQLLQ